ncbi:amidohydrolase [Microlunatus sp. Gsoil 973]|uniref:amidohydrolase family protein n=1 Tax=Microlunatus sp. Gsoil 973 TaxID=2672569 RepID=UPI0012B4CABD|nr:amidohydrolase family protein [Microlunatus sp. Gsoil 973]QGN34270.1 amidohydrolase family protein [Microlunatus sp. Gsoil 973]
MVTIDAHQHFWRTAAQEQSWRTSAHRLLERDYLPDDLDPELRQVGVDGTVLMQSVDEPAENDRLADFAAHASVAGVVAWMPIKEPEAALVELDRVRIERLCGVRCLIAEDPLAWLTEPPALRLFEEIARRGLVWDVVPITAAQTAQVIKLARLVPELKIVVDHLGRPPLDTGGWSPWADHLAELAQSPAVALKVSVGIDALTAWTAWDPAELDRYVAHAVDQFGADRLLLGSNWPVVLLRASYASAWNDVRLLLYDHLATDDERAAVVGGTAVRVYGLDPSGSVGERPADRNATAHP